MKSKLAGLGDLSNGGNSQVAGRRNQERLLKKKIAKILANCRSHNRWKRGKFIGKILKNQAPGASETLH